MCDMCVNRGVMEEEKDEDDDEVLKKWKMEKINAKSQNLLV